MRSKILLGLSILLSVNTFAQSPVITSAYVDSLKGVSSVISFYFMTSNDWLMQLPKKGANQTWTFLEKTPDEQDTITYSTPFQIRL